MHETEIIFNIGWWEFLFIQIKHIGKTRDLFKKIRDTTGTLYAKMGTIKDRNDTDPTEAEDIKERWQEYREQLYKKDLYDTENHDGMIIDLEQTSWNAKSSVL